MYIEREEAIKELREVYEYEYPTASGAFDEYANRLVPNILRNLPAADVAPVVHGEWKFCGADRWNDAYQCSECGKIATDDSNYCPNCGADMRPEGGAE